MGNHLYGYPLYVSQQGQLGLSYIYSFIVFCIARTSNMLPSNMLLVAGNMLSVSRQHVSLCIQQQTGNKLATVLFPWCNMLLVAGNIAGQHVAWCKRGFKGEILTMRRYTNLRLPLPTLPGCDRQTDGQTECNALYMMWRRSARRCRTAGVSYRYALYRVPSL